MPVFGRSLRVRRREQLQADSSFLVSQLRKSPMRVMEGVEKRERKV